MSESQKEEIFEVMWHGPYTQDSFQKEVEEAPDFGETLCLYAKYEDHPLYGRKVLTYIGKAVRQSVSRRLSQHDLTTETIYVANIRRFSSWEQSEEIDNKPEYRISDYVRTGEDASLIVSQIEELLIYALWPAGNIRNKNTASGSWKYRLFNTGDLGDLPPEVSGHYALYNSPKPEEKQ